MIRTVADLLSEILAVELPKLDASPVAHAPTIGEMYEGLSGRLLEQALPQGIGLKVVTGFVRGHDDTLSGQIDRMLVLGDAGERVPETDRYIWPVQDVVAVFEVKKSLTKSALKEALAQVHQVRVIDSAFRNTPGGQLTYAEEAPARKAFAEMTGRFVPSLTEAASMSRFERLLFPALIVEATSVIRVVIGWHGFKRERTLRRHLADYVEESVGQQVAGPTALPQLIISGDFALAKANGQPFSPNTEGDRWPFYGSTAINPLVLLLEFIWTRLDARFGLGNVWGEDLGTEVLRGLLVGEAVEHNGQSGWKTHIYRNTSTKNLRAAAVEEAWQPEQFTHEPFVVLQTLVSGREVRSDDPGLLEWLGSRNRTWADVRGELISSRLVAESTDGRLALLAKKCDCAFLPTGEYVAAENNTGRLTRWIAKRTAAQKET